MPRICAIAALSQNRVIGKDNRLPWHLPADLQHFKRLTLHHPIVMGRSTYESIGRPLPDRTNIVLTHQRDYLAPGCEIAHDLDAALALAGTAESLFIIGGATLYQQYMPRISRLYLTIVQAEIEGDTYFPAFTESAWKVIESSQHAADEKNAYAYEFRTLDRLASS